MKKSISSLLGVALFGLVSSLSGRAHAGQIADCSVSSVAYVNDQLIIQCANSIEVQAFGPSFTSCGQRQSSDTMRMLLSIVQSAFLSGHHLTVNYNTDTSCTANNNAVVYVKIF